MNNDNEIYPLTIVADRYGGCYSGAAFIAWNKDTVEVPEDSQGSDRTYSVFWANVNREEIGMTSSDFISRRCLLQKGSYHDISVYRRRHLG